MVLLLLVTAVLIVPLIFLGSGLAENVAALLERVRQRLNHGPPVPSSWVAKPPIVGSSIYDRWQAMSGSGAKLTEELMQYLIPFRDEVLRSAAKLGKGIFPVSLSVFIVFFYKDGKRYPKN